MPAGRLTEGMAIMQTGLVAGVAPGATASGFVIDHQGRRPRTSSAWPPGWSGPFRARAAPRE